MAGTHTSYNSHSDDDRRRWSLPWRFMLLWCLTVTDADGITATSRPFGIVAVGGVASNVIGTGSTRPTTTMKTTTTTTTTRRRRRTFKHRGRVIDLLDHLQRIRGGSQSDHSGRGYNDSYGESSSSGRQGNSNDDYYYNDGGSSSSSNSNSSKNNPDPYYRDDYDNDRGRRYYNDDYYDFDDMDNDGRTNNSGDGNDGGLSRVADMMPNLIKTGNRQIGLPLLGIGTLLTVLGMSLFFNKTLMRLGNLFFVAGVPMTLGPGRTAGYFLQPRKARATACLVVGVFLVFVGWPILGLVLEIFGLLNLFGNMFPVAMAILKQMPVIGPLLKGEIGGGGGGGSNGARRNGDGSGYRYDDYYDDDGRYRGRDDDRDGYYNDDRGDFNQPYY